MNHQKTTCGEVTELVSIVNRYPEGIRRKDIEQLLHLDTGTVGKYLRRATDSGRIDNPKRGLYTPVTSVTSVTSEDELLPENVSLMTNVTPIHKGGGSA